MILTMTHHEGRTYFFGAVWPQGRSAAADAAQVRQCERDLASVADETKTN